MRTRKNKTHVRGKLRDEARNLRGVRSVRAAEHVAAAVALRRSARRGPHPEVAALHRGNRRLARRCFRQRRVGHVDDDVTFCDPRFGVTQKLGGVSGVGLDDNKRPRRSELEQEL